MSNLSFVDRNMFMRYWGGGVGHAVSTSSNSDDCRDEHEWEDMDSDESSPTNIPSAESTAPQNETLAAMEAEIAAAKACLDIYSPDNQELSDVESDHPSELPEDTDSDAESEEDEDDSVLVEIEDVEDEPDELGQEGFANL